MTNVIGLLPAFLTAVPERPRRWYEVILWWEARRIPYNLIVGLAGFVGLMMIFLFDALPPRLPLEQADFEYLFAPVVAAVVANLAYRGGWVSEVLVRVATGRQLRTFAPLAFSAGLLSSVVLVLAPGALDGLFWVYRASTGAGQ